MLEVAATLPRADRHDEPDRAALEARYRELVLHDLPRRAVDGRWVVRADHRFGRIVLDQTVGGCWYDVLDRRRGPAFTQLERRPTAAIAPPSGSSPTATRCCAG